LTILAQLRLDCKDPTCFLHGLDGIEYEVHQDLLQLHTVCLDLWKIGNKIGADRDRIQVGLGAQQPYHFADNSVQVDQLTLWRRLLVERTYTVDDFSRTIPVLIDSACCRTGPIQVGRFVCQRGRHLPCQRVSPQWKIRTSSNFRPPLFEILGSLLGGQ
jgi:hypothetical protein